MRLEGKVAMITGAASGIGRAMAIEFAAEGASVVIADTSETGGTDVADAIRENGGVAKFVNTDVTRAQDAEGAVSRAVELYGALDILMNNAGIMVQGAVTEITEEDWAPHRRATHHGGYGGCGRLGLRHRRAHHRAHHGDSRQVSRT